MTRISAAVAAALLLLAGCGGSSSRGESAGAFVKRITTEFSRGQAGRLWDELVPAEQQLVPRTRYVACQANRGFRLRSFKVLEEYGDDVSVAAKTRAATAVSVQVTSDDGVTTATVHALRVDGRWRWMLQPAQLAAYRAGRCP